ncbi:recombinase family protein [Actinomadura alba]|uniref:Recombinase family protein n=1 Tax=Actinomadura alba TaxID=406431 RepID=A0ABR7LIH1_9ACTN|nr:recombinase family protein [Actinomadura alba]MBC6464305.1 recombinase family protein [Actinomadura alba]
MDAPESPIVRECVLYLRKSKGKAGLARQERDCRTYADRIGWRIVQVFTDKDSTAHRRVGAARPKRDDYQNMLTVLRADQRPVPLGVLSWHADRLDRDPGEAAEFTDIAAVGGHLVETPRAGAYDLGTPTGRKRFRDDVSHAAYEVDHLIERVESAKIEAAAEGRWLGGKRPFGFEADGETIRPKEAELIDVSSGQVLVGVSMLQLERDWRAAGSTTTGGKQPTANEIRRILLRPRNAGISVHRGREVGPARWLPVLLAGTYRPRWEAAEGKEREAIEAEWRAEAEARFRAVAVVLTDPNRRTSPGPERRWLGSGQYRCGYPIAEAEECGRPSKMGTAGNGSRAGRPTPAYRCSGPKRHVVRAAESLDDFVEEAIITRLSEPDAAATFAPPAARDDAAELHVRAATLRTRITEAGDMWEEGELTRAEYVERKGRLQGKLDRINEQIAASVQTSVFDGLLGVEDVAAAWDALSLSRKRAVLDALVTVTILPAPRGRPKGWEPGKPYFNPGAVRLEWKPPASTAGRPRRRGPGAGTTVMGEE